MRRPGHIKYRFSQHYCGWATLHAVGIYNPIQIKSIFFASHVYGQVTELLMKSFQHQVPCQQWCSTLINLKCHTCACIKGTSHIWFNKHNVYRPKIAQCVYFMDFIREIKDRLHIPSYHYFDHYNTICLPNHQLSSARGFWAIPADACQEGAWRSDEPTADTRNSCCKWGTRLHLNLWIHTGVVGTSFMLYRIYFLDYCTFTLSNQIFQK